jgi:SAM-dependent methyltransferase
MKFPWPWADNSVDELHCSHFLEHVPGGHPVEYGGTGIRHRFVDEMYRVLKPGGTATIIVPYNRSPRAAQDPFHAWPPLEPESFMYFNKQWRVNNGLDHYPIKSDFDFTYGYGMYPGWAARSEESRNFALAHYWNVAADLHVVLTKREA